MRQRLNATKKKAEMSEVVEKGEKTLFDPKSYVDEAAVVSDSDRLSMEAFMADLLNEERPQTLRFSSSAEWTARILTLRRKHRVQPSKEQMGLLYREMLASASIVSTHEAFEAYLRKKATRSLSGIVVIAVVMSPYPTYTDAETGELKQQRFSCAKNCHYCPNEPGMPRSYLSEEGAIARAARANFDAIQQFYCRANTLKKLGHAVDKIELSVLGGTFSQYPRQYQIEFLRDLFWSANTFHDGIALFSAKRERRSLAEEIKIHETSASTHKCRIVGLTLETRPDTICDFAAVRRLREFGATRLQIGVQHTDDAVLLKINRGCEHADAVRCVRLLKNSGYKIDIHLMPNLPGSNAQKDARMFADIGDSDLLQADQWKVYPCQTVDFTVIQKWHAEGSYKPYPLDELMEVVVQIMANVKPWIRLNRIFRALPVEHITVGITQTNFRQHLVGIMKQRKMRCRDIRAREVGTHVRNGTFSPQLVAPENIQIKIREYKSSGGREFFISLESRDEAVLIGFVRLRCPPCLLADGSWHPRGFVLDEARYGTRDEYAELNRVFPELYHAALVREAHVYGFKVTTGDGNAGNENQTGQSRGYGMRLMTEAERIAQREGYARVAVISGVGTRAYYRAKMGYRNDATYMVKDLVDGTFTRAAAVLESDESVDELFEERIAASVGPVMERSAVKSKQMELLSQMAKMAFAVCASSYLAMCAMPVVVALLLSVFFMGALNYALFWGVQFGAANSAKVGRTNRALLVMSRFSMLLLDMALLGKAGSTLLPTATVRDAAKIGLGPLAIAMGWDEEPSDSGADCLCSSYWALSLVCYVSAIYAVKLLYYKRASLMTADPMVKRNSPPCSVVTVMASLVVVFLVCEYLVINLTDSECTGKGPGQCCRDTFAPVNTWFAIAAIALDLAVLVRFMSRWNEFLSMFAEESAAHLMNQFLLVSVVMLSCVWNAVCHLSIVYSAATPADVDSFTGTPAFLIDVCLMGTCIVLAFVDAQQTINKSTQMRALQDAHELLKRVAAALRASSFGDGSLSSLAAQVVDVDSHNALIDEEP